MKLPLMQIAIECDMMYNEISRCIKKALNYTYKSKAN
jgi:hypothetical protein